MKLVFLVYDSRSGSTLLSREIAAHFPGVWVSPEIRFDAFFGRTARWWRRAGPDAVHHLLASARIPDNLELAPADARRLAAGARNPRELIESLVNSQSGRNGAARPAEAVIKSGMHLRIGRRILEEIPDARFIFMVRDPRAAIVSKLATERPYHPGQKMAWAGALVAALQWRWYTRLARRLGGHVELHVVAYEQLLAAHRDTLDALSRFFAIATGSGGATYRVPAAERSIHGRVEAGGLEGERATAWREELSPDDQAVIELVCSREMRRLGYEPELQIGVLRTARVLATSLVRSAGLLLGELARRLSSTRRDVD
jgi:Sulfotransferase family